MYLKQRGEVLDNRAKHNALQVKVRTPETAQVDRLRTAPSAHGESMPTEHESKNDSQFDPSLQCTDQTCDGGNSEKVKTTRPRVESSNDINKKRRELQHGAERDSIEQHNCGLLVWTLGVCTADGHGKSFVHQWLQLRRMAGVRLWCKVDLRRSDRPDSARLRALLAMS